MFRSREGADESKFLYARRLAATFAYLALLHLDTVAIVPFAERLRKPLVASGGRERYHFFGSFELQLDERCLGGEEFLALRTRGFDQRLQLNGYVVRIKITPQGEVDALLPSPPRYQGLAPIG